MTRVILVSTSSAPRSQAQLPSYPVPHSSQVTLYHSCKTQKATTAPLFLQNFSASSRPERNYLNPATYPLTTTFRHAPNDDASCNSFAPQKPSTHGPGPQISNLAPQPRMATWSIARILRQHTRPQCVSISPGSSSPSPRTAQSAAYYIARTIISHTHYRTITTANPWSRTY